MCNDDKKFVEFMAEFTQSLHNKKVNGVSFDDLCVDKETGKTKSCSRYTGWEGLVMDDFKQLTEQLLKFYIDTESVDDIGFENFFDDNSSIIGTGKHEFFRNFRNHINSM